MPGVFAVALDGRERFAQPGQGHRNCVVVGRVRHRAQQTHAMEVAGDVGQEFASPHARHAGRDGLEVATIFQRRVGFGVQRVHLAWGAVKEQHHERFGPAERWSRRCGADGRPAT